MTESHIRLVFSALLGLTIACLLASDSDAAQKQRSGTRPRAAAAKSVFVDAEPDLTLDRLPPNFRGQDPRAVYRNLAARQVQKGEFETTAAFDARALATQGDVGIRRYAFACDVDPYHVGLADYDADRGVLRTTTLLDRGCLTLSSVILRKNSYRARNAYGVAVTVDATESEDYRLLFGHPQRARRRGSLFDEVLEISERGGRSLELSVPLAADIASRDKNLLRMLVIGRAVSSYSSSFAAPATSNGMVSEDVEWTRPTIGSPEKTDTRVKFIHFAIDEIWLFNSATGEVRAKWDVVNSEEELATSGLDIGSRTLSRRFVGDDAGAVHGEISSNLIMLDEPDRLTRDPRNARVATNLLRRTYAFWLGGKAASVVLSADRAGAVVTIPTIELREGSRNPAGHPSFELLTHSPSSGSTYLMLASTIADGPGVLVARVELAPEARLLEPSRLGVVLVTRIPDGIAKRDVAARGFVDTGGAYVERPTQWMKLHPDSVLVIDLNSGVVVGKATPVYEPQANR